MSSGLVILSNHLRLCHPLLLLLSIPMENPMDSVKKAFSVTWPHSSDFLRMKSCHLRSDLHFPDLADGDQGVESEAECWGRRSLLPHTPAPRVGTSRVSLFPLVCVWALGGLAALWEPGCRGREPCEPPVGIIQLSFRGRGRRGFHGHPHKTAEPSGTSACLLSCRAHFSSPRNPERGKSLHLPGAWATP